MRILFALLAVMIISGCTSPQAVVPSFNILSPAEGQVIDGSTVEVSLVPHDIKLTEPNGSIVEGEGHFGIYLDNANEQTGPQTSFTYGNVAPGTHTIRIEIHRGDHSQYVPQIIKAVSFTISQPSNQLPTPSTQAVKEFNITANNWAFEPAVINVAKGDMVIINAVSLDKNHGLSIPEFGVNLDLKPGVLQTTSFTADRAGEFTFFCSVFCGAGHQSMRGKLVVTDTA